MASACVNSIGMSPEKFLDCSTNKFHSYGWLSPRISFSREFPDEEATKPSTAAKSSPKNQPVKDNAGEEKPKDSDPEISANDYVDFEFRLEDPAIMLPADELFSDGKLVPLQLSTVRQSIASAPLSADVKSPDTPQFHLRSEISSTDPCLFSPKAPRCSSRWKELLGLKKLYPNSNSKQEDLKKESSSSSHGHSKNNTSRSLKHFLHRSSKSSLKASMDSSLSLPLLKDMENESVSISSRLSLSSASSSGHENDDLPRLSLDSDKPNNISRNAHQTTNNLSRVRFIKRRSALASENPTAPTRAGRSPIRRASESRVPVRGVSVDSPRMNSSGKIVFHSLERSSSSPSTFNGGPRYKHRGMERSYSANVRVTPVLNVPVCSIRGSSKSGVFGFPLFSTQQKKENGSTNAGSRTQHQSQQKPRGSNMRD